jgi:hypothetical protein
MAGSGLLFSEGRKREMEKRLLTLTKKESIVSFPLLLRHRSTITWILFRRIGAVVLALTILCFSQGQAQNEGLNQPPSVESKSERQLNQQMQRPPTHANGEDKKPSSISQVSPLTEEEQREFEKFGGDWETPNVFKNESEAIKYLEILLKGNEKTIRWYQKLGMAGETKEESEKWKKWKYGDNIATALDAINIETNKEGYKLAVEVLKTKRDYPEALAKAALVVKFAHDPNVIPTLKEISNYPVPWVRLEVAGSLVSLGDSDTALPILDALAEKEGYVQALYYLFSAPGKIIDERGYSILEKALNNSRAEIKISATKLLWESKKIKKEKAEEIALGILEKLKSKTLKDYGYETIPELPPSPNMPGSKIYYSSCRACDYTISMLSDLKSSKALPVLRFIRDNNTKWWYVCKRGVKEAIEAIEKKGGQNENFRVLYFCDICSRHFYCRGKNCEL